MNKVEKERLVNYRRWLYQAELSETKLTAYNCPKCLEKLQTTEAPERECWDTFSNCPYCGSLLYKVTHGAKVEIELITNLVK
jgi:Zn finger protein HypA/HybF involved in hydrogenase expression